MTFIYYYSLLFNSIQHGIKINSNQTEDQMGSVLHWSHQKEPKQAKSKDEVIRRNLDRIHISAAAPPPTNPHRHGQVSLIKNK